MKGKERKEEYGFARGKLVGEVHGTVAHLPSLGTRSSKVIMPIDLQWQLYGKE